ncbi:MAG: NAD-dependent epimerase/dehydratase family protein [Deltaproteobacteria bacterium]|jgi:dolichol-phosphate mannosyltransferase|nr:NAD-dependent epimerase/dehydratase family protein [Deltaproteobacteria bacterium]
MNKEILYKNIWSSETIAEAQQMSGPILIVGVSGFIGAALYYTLSSLRPDVYGCSRNPFQSWRLIDAKPESLITCDISDFNSVRQVIEKFKPQTVINLAAYGAYSRQVDTEKIHQINYIGTLNLLRMLAEVGCVAYIQTGSSSEYGINCSAPKETDITIPNSDYATSKLAASNLITYYGKVLNFPCVNLRLYSIYGPWEAKDRLIPALIQAGLKGDYPNFVDKNIARDFVYIDDCTAAIVRASSSICYSNPGISINIASGKKTTLEELALLAKDIFKIEKDPVFGKMTNKKWDLQNWYGNPQLAKDLMNWQTQTDLADGLKSYFEWQRAASTTQQFVVIPKKEQKISVIIACYRDAQAIPIIHQRLTEVLSQTGYDYEIIFVNDASPANDEKVISLLCRKDSHVIGISHSRNFGSQSAFISGMEIASGDAVVLMDGDGQDPPELIARFIEHWEKGYDVIYGRRVKREAPLYMQFFYKLFYRLFHYLAEIQVPVDAGDFSLMDKKVVTHLLSFAETDIFLRGLRAWVGFQQIGVDYIRPERLFGVSTNNFMKNIWWAKKGIFSFSTKPLVYIQVLGVMMFLFTFFLGLYYLINYYLNPEEPHVQGVMTIVMLLLGIGSVLIISVSIIGDYIGKIIEEVKARPKFIRNKLLINGNEYQNEQEINKIIERRKRKF